MEPTVANNFVDAFKDALAGIEAGAKEAGSSITEICRETGISRTTPDRWKENPPITIELVARMQDAVNRKLKKAARKKAAQEKVKNDAAA